MSIPACGRLMNPRNSKKVIKLQSSANIPSEESSSTFSDSDVSADVHEEDRLENESLFVKALMRVKFVVMRFYSIPVVLLLIFSVMVFVPRVKNRPTSLCESGKLGTVIKGLIIGLVVQLILGMVIWILDRSLHLKNELVQTGMIYLKYSSFYITTLINSLVVLGYMAWVNRTSGDSLIERLFTLYTLEHALIWVIPFFSVFLFKALVFTKVKMNFNHSVYVERIRRNLITELFFTLLKLRHQIKLRDSTHSKKAEKVLDKIMPVLVFFGLDKDKNSFIKNKIRPFLTKRSLNEVERENVILKFKKSIKAASGLIDPFVDKDSYRKKVAREMHKIFKGGRGVEENLDSLVTYFNDTKTFLSACAAIGIDPNTPVNITEMKPLYEAYINERFYLSTNLKQMSAAIDRVSMTITIFIYIITITMFVVSMNKSIKSTNQLFTLFLGGNFVMFTLVTELVEGIIYLFFVHPYDIGDRIFITENGEQANLVVREFNVLSTTFYSYEGAFITIPNAMLSKKIISNVTKSGNMSESYPITISHLTPPEKISKLKEMVRRFVRSHPKYYSEFFMLNYEKIEEGNKLTIRIYIQYIKNFQNYDFYLKRKTIFFNYLVEVLKTLKITYKPLTHRIEIIKETNKENHPA